MSKQAHARELLAHNIRRLRNAAGLSQSELGDLTDLTKSRVSEYERGVYACSVDVLDRLARALGVPVAALFDEAGIEKPMSASDAGRKQRSKKA